MTDKAQGAAERELFEQAYLAEFGDPRHIVNHGVELAWMTGPGAMWRAGRAALKAQPAPTEAQGEDSARLDADCSCDSPDWCNNYNRCHRQVCGFPLRGTLLKPV